ncbi:uncharacterized protein LACBIDRAFT_330381 [Laccaria bicolor S238N-H82]|uniref:Predicted protein n=1 Tax=Laccaria bicolor (strain S238N-H82 / ATCC MYA-4686) TaxID=486041 RepID=B0DL48_LACBS|nr:uncharacterized protein LACBIDRAFT_330381 [Laccaria bicolor S238N-H82]EDR04766.1 predicted protein [Laccaria bicolor S238N-H82]|eukprot:XP_001884590.1 predicted protein [Laccaria bicolor S238N-H82]
MTQHPCVVHGGRAREIWHRLVRVSAGALCALSAYSVIVFIDLLSPRSDMHNKFALHPPLLTSFAANSSCLRLFIEFWQTRAHQQLGSSSPLRGPIHVWRCVAKASYDDWLQHLMILILFWARLSFTPGVSSTPVLHMLNSSNTVDKLLHEKSRIALTKLNVRTAKTQSQRLGRSQIVHARTLKERLHADRPLRGLAHSAHVPQSFCFAPRPPLIGLVLSAMWNSLNTVDRLPQKKPGIGLREIAQRVFSQTMIQHPCFAHVEYIEHCRQIAARETSHRLARHPVFRGFAHVLSSVNLANKPFCAWIRVQSVPNKPKTLYALNRDLRDHTNVEPQLPEESHTPSLHCPDFGEVQRPGCISLYTILQVPDCGIIDCSNPEKFEIIFLSQQGNKMDLEGGLHRSASERYAVGSLNQQVIARNYLIKHSFGDGVVTADMAGILGDMQQYLDQAREILGNSVEDPQAAISSNVRMEYKDLDIQEREHLMMCFNGIGKCCSNGGDVESALMWHGEVESIYQGFISAQQDNLTHGGDYGHGLLFSPEASYQRIKGLVSAAQQLFVLGNTGTSVQRRWNAHEILTSLPVSSRTPRIRALIDAEELDRIIQIRHPDPVTPPTSNVVVPTLQIRGLWQKHDFRTSVRTTLARFGFASFIWRTRLYMAGGQTDARHSFRDLWCLDLSQVQQEWRRLEDYPIPLAVTGQFYGWQMKIRDDKAYLFTGRPELDFYDLLSERWSSVMTTYVPTAEDRYAGVEGDWPYPGFRVVEAAVELAHDKLLVFGGTHKGSALGCNLLMELDLTSNTWKRLSGFVITPLWGHRSLPGPRKAAASWLNSSQDTLHILFGLSDRYAAQLEQQSHGAQDSYAYDDLWSWDIKSHGWSKKKLCGNPPSPRCEMAYCYNRKLDLLITFGGYNPTVPTADTSKNQMFAYSYYADTFAMCNETQKWRHILSPGFPTYRSHAGLVSDESTGRTYLLGGFVNTDYIPSRSRFLSKSLGDMWELCLDVPGSSFNHADYIREQHGAPAGPWKRCFTCGRVGLVKKCGAKPELHQSYYAGTCNGRAAFCNTMCLKNGWKMHKEIDECLKK